MSQQENTSSSAAVNNLLQAIIESGDTEITSGSPIIVRKVLGTLSGSGTPIVEQLPAEINQDKPWREVIKRRFTNGGSDY